MRPRQWVKNVLVLAAPFAGGELFAPGIALQLVIAFAAFSLAASGIYLVNDANDVEADRAHPTKRLPADRGRHRAGPGWPSRWPWCCWPARWR